MSCESLRAKELQERGMPRRSIKPRNPWEDRFETPSAAALLASFPRHQAAILQVIRDGLTALAGARETVVWRGTWCWTLAYTLETEPERPWAYLVPRPMRPVLALPLTGDMVAALPVKRISKAVRDGIALAPLVGGIYWPACELAHRTVAEELLLLARRKHAILTAAASAV
jgi:hypothetical protein